jgi:hypothetical protein
MAQYGAFLGMSSVSQRQWSHAYVDYGKLKSILKPAKTTKDLLTSVLRQDLIVSVSTGFCAQLQLEIAKARNHVVDTELVLLATCDPRKLSFVTLPNLKELGRLISDLEEFRVINYVAVLKALKKHDELLGMHGQTEGMAALEASPLPRSSPVLSDCSLLLQAALKELELKQYPAPPRGTQPDEPLQGLPEECMICWDRAVVSLNLRCGHSFCTDCLEEAAKHDHKACPVCRDPQPLDPDEVRIGKLLSTSSEAPGEYFPSTVFNRSETTGRGPSLCPRSARSLRATCPPFAARSSAGWRCPSRSTSSGTPLRPMSGPGSKPTPKPVPAVAPVNTDEKETARRELRASSWPMPQSSQSLAPTPPPPMQLLNQQLLQQQTRADEKPSSLIGRNLLLRAAGQSLPQRAGLVPRELSTQHPVTLPSQPMQHLQQEFQQTTAGFGSGAAGAAQRDRSPDSSGDGEPGVRSTWKTRNQDPRIVAERLVKDNKTTIMLGNLPSTATTEMVMQAVQYLGFMEAVTFSFVLVNTRTGKCKGYGFVDVDRPEAAARLCLAMTGFHFPNSGQKRTQVSVADTQGTFATLWRLCPWKKKNAVIFETYSPPFVRTSEQSIGPMTAEEAVAYLRPRVGSAHRERGEVSMRGSLRSTRSTSASPTWTL